MSKSKSCVYEFQTPARTYTHTYHPRLEPYPSKTKKKEQKTELAEITRKGGEGIY
jgi:hypothetical protein